jgi:hypothetical protein
MAHERLLTVVPAPLHGWGVRTSRTLDMEKLETERQFRFPIIAFAVYTADDTPHRNALRPVVADCDCDRWLVLNVDNAEIVRLDTGVIVSGQSRWAGAAKNHGATLDKPESEWWLNVDGSKQYDTQDR